MTQEDLLEWTRRRPFLPFRLYYFDGTAYEIRHPEMCMAACSIAVIGLPRHPDHPVAERVEVVSLSHVVRLEPLVLIQASA